MNRAGFAGSTLGAVLLAVLLMRAPATAPGASTNPQQGQSSAGQNSAANQAGDDSGKGPWDASRRHFAGFEPGRCVLHAASKTGGQRKASPKQAEANTQNTDKTARWCIPQNEQVRAMIAILPDPVHSHMSLVYDRSVEALQLAAESAGYVIDRYWLPWETEGPKSGFPQPAVKNAGETESQPGLLMFRWSGDVAENGEPKNGVPEKNGASVLYVFLVDDTSTAGINGIQFSNAVEYVEQVCGLDGQGCGGKAAIRIMGPTFSGSLDSLRRLTEHRTSHSFRVYSGTVSSEQAQESLRGPNFEVATCRQDRNCTEAEPPHLVFRSLVTDTEAAVNSFVKSLQDDKQIECEDRDHPEVAIFSEAATTYGGTARRGARGGQGCYANFSYPREIASLRNAYQQSGRQPSSPAAGTATTAQNYLPFSLADTQPNRSDEPPVVSRQQGPLSQEAVLMKYANELRREHYRYVGIIGSNVLDVLFLASFLRNACPDVRVFVFNADLLMERDSDNVPYIGMLTLSTYPLIARNLYWTRSGDTPSRLPFADQYQEGQYNAALLAMSEVVPQPFKGKLYEFRQPFTQSPERFDPASTALPLWVSVVGTGGFWPVKIIPRGSPGEERSSQHPVMAGVDYTGAWKVIAAMVCAISFFYALLLWTDPSPSSRFRDFAITGPVCGQRLFFVNLISVNLALCLAMAATPAWRFGLFAGPTVQILAAITALAIIVLFLVSMRLCKACCSLWQQEDKTAGAAKVMLFTGGTNLGLWIIALAGEWLWLCLFTDGPSHYGFFFAYRVVHLATGVSPFTPLLPLFAAFCFWSICELWRLRFNEELRPRLSVSPGFPGAHTEARIARSLNGFLLRTDYVVAFLLILALWLFFFKPRRPFHLFEDFTFSVLYEVLFGLVVALMLSAGLRLGQVWSDTKKLLGELQRSPIRYAFSRLKGASWSPIWQSGGEDAQLLNRSQSFEVLGEIKRCCCALDKDLNLKVKEALDLTGHEMVPAIQASLAAVLDEALKALKKYWDENGPGEDQTVEGKAEAKAPDPRPPHIARLEQYVALRYVDFIRGVLMHVRHLLILLAVVYSLALVSLNLYSFEPHQSLIWSFTGIFALIGLSGLGVLVQAHRDEILSRITGTKPNELGLGFYVRAISLGAAPLVTLLATHFPAIGKLFWSIFQPGLEALK